MKKTQKDKIAENKERTKAVIKFNKVAMDKNTTDAEGILISYHILKDGVINHYFDAHFPIADWGKCVIAMGVEARSALLRTQSGQANAR